MEDDDPFMSQLKGSAAANLIFAGAFLVFKLLSAKCKHLKCKSTSKCCECSAREDSYSDNTKEDEDILRLIDQKIAEIKGGVAKSLREGRAKTIRALGQQV